MNSFIKYSSLGLQMGVSITVLAYLGVYLDKYYANKQPWLTILFVLIAIVGSIVKLIIDLGKENESNENTD